MTYVRTFTSFLTNISALYMLIVINNLIMFFPRTGKVNSYGNFDRRYARGLGRTPRQRRSSLYRKPRFF